MYTNTHTHTHTYKINQSSTACIVLFFSFFTQKLFNCYINKCIEEETLLGAHKQTREHRTHSLASNANTSVSDTLYARVKMLLCEKATTRIHRQKRDLKKR